VATTRNENGHRIPKQALQYISKGRRNLGRLRKRWRSNFTLRIKEQDNTPKPSWTWWWLWYKLWLVSDEQCIFPFCTNSELLYIPHFTLFVDYGQPTHIQGRQRRSRWAFGAKQNSLRNILHYHQFQLYL
jgi:hypothetical protein